VDDTHNILNQPLSDAQNSWIASNQFPICPASVITMSQNCGSGKPVGTCYGNDAASKWAVRGAINAGMSVFLYVQSIETPGPSPDYDQCELLK
jgi:hypothetical protein